MTMLSLTIATGAIAYTVVLYLIVKSIADGLEQGGREQ